ncbi:bifunctional tRNA (5-methylaminomethyl-2-thiouridine)(34)-methyltransferase MnmD/FAD-dependent 5-carboxymethylaminomethyl-2-thiouridine(34) oxidoreductase MnmC [Chromohalobacter canadensis]|uniref:bifunctional tRNA (5-methylaminomethyl-2-thiouridine)(34)-methyltransferase MnmD/FAD-dependent 5-carboxymethylaminomethyl-2-thiouridine(34) oxidoreductase MnmC n=1 Tax=Chromohalobacter canadensis TaxID=141389 RepID=UPI0021BE54D1|nr:bifunctional tRNA (5-methylaminomethyl-2-thiouridine)(34)-methyltransferase MnmD/FAD-dependent 5-carboxymethylaminomethyl-2-thiouridine(34) oxidoreductase MnmC [Chromohalobacter canadensis]MCT8467195.1 bifunctional tRNA (5-methylaminomethyl-2-thiouridine)(34)-methyltransferase MnmD/FAD-dependent 5-carboxymethylaminomethyl-2-thiouridine(34) oxidoreductase MnmC [Chromohalobacter canadensis]MCT8471057.1 bifunctional tRNA (5-methylaminomethyl-2-thiouridine)(34)-methyltransferase MnmD/FAD-dependent
MSPPPSPLPPLTALSAPDLEWRADDVSDAPYSCVYNDVYFSRHDGRAETMHVFLDGNHLPERFAAWQEARPFVIGETGFGTGLNMLCAWTCFERYAPAQARLHLVSTEKYPLPRDALARALAIWPDLAAHARPLIDQWPEPLSGVHRLWLSERVTLDLHFGDAAERLSRLDGRVDAWFLDGFSPAKNPDMWQAALYEAMANVSRPGASFATFTCAGVVKRGLRDAGFTWRKVPGFGRKREMLCGEIAEPPDDTRRTSTPWFTPPRARPARQVVVIGAGLAGTSVAAALARRGVAVTLLERDAPGAGASGNRQGALYVKLAAETNPQSRVYLAGLLHTRRWLATLDPEQRLWQDCGVLQLATGAKEAARQQRFLAHHALPERVVHGVDATTASQAAGTPLDAPGLDYPQAGWVRPDQLCQYLATSPGITQRRGEARDLDFDADADAWRIALTDGTTLTADHVVVATAHEAPRFTPLAGLPLKPIRGQLTHVPVPADAPSLARVVCAGGYVAPAMDGVLSLGATFAPGDTDTAVHTADHARNLAEFEATLPAFAEALREAGVTLDPAACEGRASLRAASPDKSPYAGPVPIREAWLDDYAVLGADARRVPDTPGQHHPGLWVSTAHGSRGLASAPLCAEVIASRLCDEPLPLERELIDHLHPGRRLIADIIRGNATLSASSKRDEPPTSPNTTETP